MFKKFVKGVSHFTHFCPFDYCKLFVIISWLLKNKQKHKITEEKTNV